MLVLATVTAPVALPHWKDPETGPPSTGRTKPTHSVPPIPATDPSVTILMNVGGYTVYTGGVPPGTRPVVWTKEGKDSMVFTNCPSDRAANSGKWKFKTCAIHKCLEIDHEHNVCKYWEIADSDVTPDKPKCLGHESSLVEEKKKSPDVSKKRVSGPK